MGSLYKKNWKSLQGKGATTASADGDLVRVVDSAVAVSGLMTGANGITVVADASSNIEIGAAALTPDSVAIGTSLTFNYSATASGSLAVLGLPSNLPAGATAQSGWITATLEGETIYIPFYS